MKGGSESGSRQRMIDAAIVLMRASGLSGAGINEIVRASGAPKGSVYHFFPQGKLQIAGEALLAYSALVKTFIEDALGSETLPEAKVRALFSAFARRVEDGDFCRSCAVGAVSLDLDEAVLALQPTLERILSEWTTTIAAHFDCGDEAHNRSFAGVLLTAIEGAYVRSRAERSPRAFVEAGEWLAGLARKSANPASAGGRDAGQARGGPEHGPSVP